MDYKNKSIPAESPSPRRAWIEIPPVETRTAEEMSPSPRRAWIEIQLVGKFALNELSPSPRRAWIEISSSRLILPTAL